MNIVCVICSDLLMPSDDVFYTPCGHIFHFVCLTQWLERSKTCPQCRERTTANKIHRVYFNFSNNDTIREDPSCLQEKVDKLNFQIMLRDNDIKHYKEKSDKVDKQNIGLRNEIKKMESEITEKENAIYALREQIKYFKEKNTEVKEAEQKAARLEKKLQEYRNVQTLLEAPSEDVDDMISKTRDPFTLVTYITVMKREMTTCLNKRRELRTKLKNLQLDLTKVSMERNLLLDERERRKKLEVDLVTCESEKMFLQNKLRELERNPQSIKKQSSSRSTNVDTLNPNSPKSTLKRKPDEGMNDAIIEKELVKDIETKEDENDPLSGATKESGESSPYLPVKSQGVFTFKESAQRRPTMKLGSSILAKKSRLEQSSSKRTSAGTITYDGFGGHSKYDQFPSPIAGPRARKIKDDTSKPKKQKLDTGDNQKLGNFIIDLS